MIVEARSSGLVRSYSASGVLALAFCSAVLSKHSVRSFVSLWQVRHGYTSRTRRLDNKELRDTVEQWSGELRSIGCAAGNACFVGVKTLSDLTV